MRDTCRETRETSVRPSNDYHLQKMKEAHTYSNNDGASVFAAAKKKQNGCNRGLKHHGREGCVQPRYLQVLC